MIQQEKPKEPAKLKCLNKKCKYTWKIWKWGQAECPKCSDLSIKWLNYEEMNRKYFHN